MDMIPGELMIDLILFAGPRSACCPAVHLPVLSLWALVLSAVSYKDELLDH